MPSVRLKGFVGTSYTLRNARYDCQRTVNMYPEVDETQLGKNAEIAQLARTPGLTQLTTSPSLVGKCLYKSSTGSLFYIANSTLYKINGVDGSTIGWSMTALGTVYAGIVVQMVDNGIDLFITSDGYGYTLKLATNVLSALVGSTPSCTQYFDGYVLFADINTNMFKWTDLYSTTINGLNFASAEAFPDKITGLINNNEDLWVFGERTTELWYDAGQGNTVFARRPGILIETGCIATNSIQKTSLNRLIWLASDDRSGPYLVMATGYTIARISTYAIEQVWQNLSQSQLAAATSFSYMQDGHMFYVLNIPGLASTWVYDVTTSDMLQSHSWHERNTYDLDNNESRHQAESHAYYMGKHIVSDYATGSIYFYDQNGYSDNGTSIRRIRTSPHIANSGLRLIYNNLTFDYKTGVGDNTTVDPQLILEYSNDGGNTWSNQLYKSVGKLGQYNARVVFHQLGQSRDRVFRLTMSDNIDWAISGASLDITPCEY